MVGGGGGGGNQKEYPLYSCENVEPHRSNSVRTKRYNTHRSKTKFESLNTLRQLENILGTQTLPF